MMFHQIAPACASAWNGDRVGMKGRQGGWMRRSKIFVNPREGESCRSSA